MNTALVENSSRANAAAESGEQYSLARILGIWASIALPMGLIHWVISPILIPRLNIVPGFLYFILIVVGLVWQGFVAYIVLRQEVKPFTYANIKDRLWLHTPTDPRTGLPSNRLYLWTIPMIVFVNAGYASSGVLNELWVKLLPFLTPPAYTEIQNLAEPAVGQWWLLGVLAVMIVFNYLLGEELIFRGILLPKMNGVFGKWDFVANAVLFATYHLHKTWVWPQILLFNWILPWAAKRFKSYWVSVIIHGAFDAITLVIIFTLAIMGLLQ